ncbi:MAG: hypothetical protein HC831_27650 [Chloroflexia bacterium]|nr:hypothetical protein [Chloroflexia bacterium]
MAELQSLSETAASICAPLKEIEKEKQAFDKEFAVFKEAVMKKQAKGEIKKAVDKKRDRKVSGFFYDILAETFYPHTDEAAIETVNQLKELSEKYGFKINNLRFNEETAAIDNCMKEAEKIDLSALTSNDIGRWIPLIKQANQEFKEVSKSFVEETTAAASLESASAVAPGLVHALEELFIQLFPLSGSHPPMS